MNNYILDSGYKKLFNSFGLDIGMVLKKAGLSENILNRKLIRIGEKEYYQFLMTTEEIYKDSELTIKMIITSQIESFSHPIYSSYCSKNEEICINRLSKYKKLIGPMSMIIKIKENQITVLYESGESGLKLP